MTDDERKRRLRELQKELGFTIWDDGETSWDDRLAAGAAGTQAASAKAAERRERCIALFLELRADGHSKNRSIDIIVAKTGYSHSSVSRYVKGGQSMD